MGIEPTPSAWKAEVLPLNYTRKLRKPEHPEAAPKAPATEPLMVEGVGFEPT